MKRKGDEKTMVPMFPRLHVNDAEKAGPKAPPRNKMALYEQFSIPSQRFNSKFSSSTLAKKNLPVSANERNHPQVSPSTDTHQDEKFHAGLSDVENVSTSFSQHEYMKKFGDEDDFMVPVFVQTGIGHDTSRNMLVSPGSKLLGRSIELKNDCEKLNQGTRAVKKSNDKSDQIRTYSAKNTPNLSGVEEIGGLVEKEGESWIRNFQDSPAGCCQKLNPSDTCLQKSCGNILYVDKTKYGNGVFESIKDKKKNNIRQSRNDSRSRENNDDLKEIADEIGHSDGRTKSASQLENADKSDDFSETSMVASDSAFDITPDDVVEVIGQKHFWKARREIMNQQRVFAVQVFELHRLIKVQQLIARSPHLLLENGALLPNSSLKVSPAKILPSENIAKTQTLLPHRSISNTKQNGECSAENAVGKKCLTSLSSTKSSTCGPNTENPKAGDWCFHQPPGHQWLIPVMSPSEGLVYKPYPAPGPVSIPYNPIMNPAFGVHCNPQFPPAYNMPTYGMPLVNPSPTGSAVEQGSWYPIPGSKGQFGQASKLFSPFHLQTQSSCNVQSEKDGAGRAGGKAGGSKESDLQISTGSSSCEKGWGGGKDKICKGKDALPLFPGAPVVEEPTQVIRVVPHNKRSATESAARIFRSIQQEREQND